MRRRQGFLARCRTHLGDAGEGYFVHLRIASGIGCTMVSAGTACILHGMFPSLFTDRASRTIRRLNDKIAARHNASLITALAELEYEI